MSLTIQVGPDTSDGLLVPVGQMSSDDVPFGEMGLESWLRVWEGAEQEGCAEAVAFLGGVEVSTEAWLGRGHPRHLPLRESMQGGCGRNFNLHNSPILQMRKPSHRERKELPKVSQQV